MSRSSTVETVLGQRYQLRRRIGVGGMGTVYEAEQLDTGRTVAVKVLQQHLVGEPAVHARFRREAQATANVRHPNIVEVTDFQDAPDEPPFLVMELLHGQTLKSLMKKEGPLPVARAASIAHEVARALTAAHEAGVIHRDIKPDNVFLVDTGTEALQVRLLDFGVARLMHEDDAAALGTESGAWVGTPSYMAPEQIRCRPVDGRADIYSLGACLYQMVTGQRPIDVADNVALLSAVLHNVPAPLNGVRSDVPDGFSQVVERTLQKDPSARFPSAQELVQALEPWTTPAVIAATQPAAEASPVSEALSSAGTSAAAEVPPSAEAAPVSEAQTAAGVSPAAEAAPVSEAQSAAGASLAAEASPVSEAQTAAGASLAAEASPVSEALSSAGTSATAEPPPSAKASSLAGAAPVAGASPAAPAAGSTPHAPGPASRPRLQSVIMLSGALGVGLAATGGLLLTASGMPPPAAEEPAFIRVIEAPRRDTPSAAALEPHAYSDGSVAESVELRAPALDTCYARIGEDAACRQDTYALDYSPEGVVLRARMHPPQPSALARCIDRALRGLSLGRPREAVAGTATFLLLRE